MSERITINLTEPKEEITFTLTDQKEEVVFSFSEAARGPQGEPGESASVTNAAVNAAIEDDPSATRTSLDLGTAALADTGTGASNVILGNDARLTDARTPTSHASSHVTGGTDKIRDASASQDGLMTTTFAAKLNGIEAGADVTDATNVNAAGAVMESDYSPAHSILVQQNGTGSPSSLSIGNNTLVGRLSGGGSDINDLSASQVRTLINVEDGADVTDAANVASTITGATAKTTLVDADETVLTDSAASFGLKKVTWLNVWNYIVTKIGAITSITASGAWSFSSTTRPTSSGTGTPAATSLMTQADVAARTRATRLGANISLNNSITPTNIITLSVVAGKKYQLQAYIALSGTVLTGTRHGITFPAGIIRCYRLRSSSYVPVQMSGDLNLGLAEAATIAEIKGFYECSTSGDIALTYAQNTLSADNITASTYTFLSLTEYD